MDKPGDRRDLSARVDGDVPGARLDAENHARRAETGDAGPRQRRSDLGGLLPRDRHDEHRSRGSRRRLPGARGIQHAGGAQRDAAIGRKVAGGCGRPRSRARMAAASTGSQVAEERRRRSAAGWSVGSNVFLIVIKLAAYLLSGSVSVLAEAINSSADLIGSAVTLFSVRASSAPPDEHHAYGHGKFENLSGVLIALFVLAGASFAIVEAVRHLRELSHVHESLPGIIVMAISFLVNVAVSRNLLRVGKATESPALTADGHHRV